MASSNKIARIRTNLTQETAAERIGVTPQHISNIETNKAKVSLSLLVRICNALDTTLDYILENEYHSPDSVIEHELMNTLKNMDKPRQETLLRIAKVL